MSYNHSAVFQDHFSKTSNNYAQFRPTYPISLIQFLAQLAPERQLALDCGCGTGQLSVLLASEFQKVVATDASEQQIAHAHKNERVEYKTAIAHQSGLDNQSVDLITVAQAAHWFDLPCFYQEVNRVAKKKAILALISYGVLHVEGQVDELIQHFYWSVLQPYWPKERQHVETGYQNLYFPFQEIQAPSFTIEVKWTLNELIGYISTWSAIKCLKEQQGDADIEQFQQQLTQIWGHHDEQKQVYWPLALRIGQIN
ncbi:class I SAM-dependent methyltransferase [Neisseria sp. Ec49-e6-T10]|uniref:class I SAM-dependent methyltransferase n=1 Tax=Neisseria sp. Ec49-e6-T10 TaxID=3140744 RepID=UPI003EC00A5B